jgi:hypothetical protein
MRIGKVNRSTRRKPAPMPLCPPKIPHEETWPILLYRDPHWVIIYLIEVFCLVGCDVLLSVESRWQAELFPPKFRVTVSELHRVMSLRTVLFITTAARYTNHACDFYFPVDYRPLFSATIIIVVALLKNEYVL